MFGYVMAGTRNLPVSTAFYDAVLEPLGLIRDVSDDTFAGYSSKEMPENPEFYVTEPINEQPAALAMER